MTVQTAQSAQQPQQKVTYAATTQLQPGIKTQFFATSIAQTQKPAGAPQIQVHNQKQPLQKCSILHRQLILVLRLHFLFTASGG